ncbi:unnamed protein product [Protopolystoma xenopodis]|uniref:Uncharacterized protein n=1 Tax=Protopolystoma xenopodis TaxID=117903 RepID=A0A3S5CN75_9PLAT|nr:unnamed protein product [Protopolystoma xenopodis]
MLLRHRAPPPPVQSSTCSFIDSHISLSRLVCQSVSLSVRRSMGVSPSGRPRRPRRSRRSPDLTLLCHFAQRSCPDGLTGRRDRVQPFRPSGQVNRAHLARQLAGPLPSTLLRSPPLPSTPLCSRARPARAVLKRRLRPARNQIVRSPPDRPIDLAPKLFVTATLLFVSVSLSPSPFHSVCLCV